MVPMSADPAPFLVPGIAWALVVLFSVLWVALGIAWGRRGRNDADDFMLAGRNIGLAVMEKMIFSLLVGLISMMVKVDY